jgi:ribosomal protein S18 acetylase RimI-like enzyme
MVIALRPVEQSDIDELVAVALRAWEPAHASMAAVLGSRLNARVYPDWAASQASGVREACVDPEIEVTVAVDGDKPVGFVAFLIDHLRTHRDVGEIDMIAVDPAAQCRGIARMLTEHALTQMRAGGCTLAIVATGGDTGHAPARALYDSAGFTALPLVRYYRQL